MTFRYFLGCVIPGRLPFLETSARKTFEKIGIDVQNQPRCSCCPDPTGITLLDRQTWLTLGARNLCLYEESNSDVLSLCSGCTETLKSVKYVLDRDVEKKNEINSILKSVGKNYKGTVEIKHFAEVIFENIDKFKNEVKKPLKDLRIAGHPGCHYLRPSEIIQWDDPLNPVTLDKIIEAIGADPVDYSLKNDCCGNPVEKSDKEISLIMLEKKLKSMKEVGTDCIAVVCPACFQQFDFNQKEVNKKYNTDYNFPVLYITELIALALGLNAEELGLKFHRIKINEVLQKIS